MPFSGHASSGMPGSKHLGTGSDLQYHVPWAFDRAVGRRFSGSRCPRLVNNVLGQRVNGPIESCRCVLVPVELNWCSLVSPNHYSTRTAHGDVVIALRCAGTTHGETCVAQCSQGYTGVVAPEIQRAMGCCGCCLLSQHSQP